MKTNFIEMEKHETQREDVVSTREENDISHELERLRSDFFGEIRSSIHNCKPFDPKRVLNEANRIMGAELVEQTLVPYILGTSPIQKRPLTMRDINSASEDYRASLKLVTRDFKVTNLKDLRLILGGDLPNIASLIIEGPPRHSFEYSDEFYYGLFHGLAESPITRQLRVLKLNLVNISRNTISNSFADTDFSGLEELDISACWLDRHVCTELFRHLNYLPAIETLRLTDNPEIGYEIYELRENIPSTLRHLDLRGTKISGLAVMCLANSEEFSHLDTVRISYNLISREDLQTLLDSCYVGKAIC